MDTDYDLIVIGSGPAGEKGAAQAAYFGKKVALVEKDTDLGGAAANTGILASKALREMALAKLDGKTAPIISNIADYLRQENPLKKVEQKRILLNLERHHVELYRGLASFVDPHTISIHSQEGKIQQIRGEVILIAVGSSPNRQSIFPADDARFYDSNTVLNIQKLPKTLLIVGGGVIGCEYACMFAALNTSVILVTARSRILDFLDSEVSLTLQKQMQFLGVAFRTKESVVETKGTKPIEIQLASGNLLHVDEVLIASGRRGNTQNLNLLKVGIAVNEMGLIQTSENYQTSVPHIYAAGDVIGMPGLAATSMEQARVAMVHAFNLKYKTGLASILPYGIYTIPECSMAGETEQNLKRKDLPYIVGKTTYNHNARGRIIGEENGFLKLLFHGEDMKLLGVHIIGPHASELIHIGVMALQMGATADIFIRTCFNYPTLSEMYKYAAYDALGKQALKESGQAYVERMKTSLKFTT